MHNRFRTSRTALMTAAASLFLLSATVVGSGPVRAVFGHEPIELQVGALFPGEPVACDIELTGGPANVIISSDPPGAVSYEGPVESATETVMADTDPNMSPGSVMVYLQTEGGSTTVSASSMAIEGGDPGQL